MYRFRKLGTWLQTRYYTTLYKSKMQFVGVGTVIKGPCHIKNAGGIVMGSNVILDSDPGRPIELSVGNAAKLSIGSNVYLNHSVDIICNIQVDIGDGCLIAPYVVISDDDGHPVDWRTRHDYHPTGPENRLGAAVTIGQNVWLCTRALILKGVTIGDGAVVAAGAIVTHNVPPHTLVAGIPAKVIRTL